MSRCADLLTPGPLGDEVLGAADAPVTHHRICLDDLPALRAFPRDHLSGAEEAIHRHRQGALHLPRIPARSAGRRPASCWRAAPARTNIFPMVETLFAAAERMGGRRSRCSRCWRSPSRPASPSRASTSAWRIRRCSTASRRCASARRSKLEVSSTPTFFINGKMFRGDAHDRGAGQGDRALSQELIRVFSDPAQSPEAAAGACAAACGRRFRSRTTSSSLLRNHVRRFILPARCGDTRLDPRPGTRALIDSVRAAAS